MRFKRGQENFTRIHVNQTFLAYIIGSELDGGMASGISPDFIYILHELLGHRNLGTQMTITHNDKIKYNYIKTSDYFEVNDS